MAVKSRKVKPIPVEEEEELFEDLEEIGDEDQETDLEELEEETEELEEGEDDEEVVEPPRKRSAKKPVARKGRVSDPEDSKEIIRTVLVDGILAYMDQQIDEKIAAALAVGLSVDIPVPRKKAAKPAAPAPKKVAGKASATPQEVREWLQSNGYEVSERGRISEAAKKFYTKKTGRRVAS